MCYEKGGIIKPIRSLIYYNKRYNKAIVLLLFSREKVKFSYVLKLRVVALVLIKDLGV